jgi:hypothetical protein
VSKSKKNRKAIDPAKIVSKHMAKSGMPEGARDAIRQQVGEHLAMAMHPAVLGARLAKSGGLSSGSATGTAGGQVRMPVAPANPMQPGVAPSPSFPTPPSRGPGPNLVSQALLVPTGDIDPSVSGGPGFSPAGHNWFLERCQPNFDPATSADLDVSGGPTGDAGVPGSGSASNSNPRLATTPRRPTMGAPAASPRNAVDYESIRSQAGDSMSKAAIESAISRGEPDAVIALARDAAGRLGALQAHPRYSPPRRR